MSGNRAFATNTSVMPQVVNSNNFELLTVEQLAQRLNLPKSWIAQQTRERSADKIPHLRFGRWIRFQWLSPELTAWLARRRK